MLGSFSNGGLGMGVAFVLDDQFTGPAGAIEDSMDALSGHYDQLTKEIEAKTSRMAYLGAGLAAGGLAITAFMKKASQTRAEFESYEIQLGTVLGSVEKAQQVMNNIKADAKENPVFGTKELVEANANLIANNIEAERSRKLINNLSNALAGVGKGNKELASMGVNLQQIAATGKATGLDIKQFGMAGIPIFQLLASATGKSVEEAQKMEVTLPLLELAFEKAGEKGGLFHNALERAADSAQGLSAALEDEVIFGFEAVGKALEPLTNGLKRFAISVLETVAVFADSKVGGAIFRVVAVLGALALIIGTALLLTSGLRAVTLKLADSFAASTKAKILDAFATKGLTAALRQMAVAAWASLGPYVIIAVVLLAVVLVIRKLISMLSSGNENARKFATGVLIMLGPIGWIIIAFVKMREALKFFDTASDEMLAKMKSGGGLMGFFVRLAGFIRGAMEIWKSWNGETFTISEKLKNKLEALGIFDSVIAMGTWLVRLKELFKGVWDGIKEGALAVWGVITSVFKSITEAFSPVSKKMGELGLAIDKNTSDIDKWREAGKKIGYAILVIVGILVTGMVLASVAMIAAMIIPIIMIAAIVLVLWGLYQVFMWVWGIGVATWDGIVAGLSNLWGYMVAWWDWIVSVFSSAGEIGLNFVTSLWEGIKAAWENMTKWIKDAWNSVKEFFGFGDASEDVEAKINKKVKHEITQKSEGGAGKKEGGAVKTGVTLDKANTHKNTSKNPVINLFGSEGKDGGSSQPIIIQNIMDGEVISQKVMDKTEFKAARK